MVQAMKSIGAAHGLSRLIAPVRPSNKSQYPLLALPRYLAMEKEPGLAYDPWIRVHQRLEGRVVKICEKSMRVTGSVERWQEWTGMRFPESGSYPVPGALTLVEVDCEADIGVYVEPNVWMVHELEGE
jgi:hypothetical protein